MSRLARFPAAALAATLSLAALASFATAGPEIPPGPGRWALVGGTVHTITGGDIENGTVVVDNGRITAVGAGLAAPAGSTVIDCKGKQVYPGFIAAASSLGLIEIATIEGSNDTQETGDLNPNIRAEVMFNPDSDILPVTRINGVTSALVIPGGGAIHGTSALMHLDGWTQEDMTVRAPVALHVDWPGFGNRNPFFGPPPGPPSADEIKAQAAAVKTIRDAFGDARAYETARAAESGKGVPAHDADVRWDAMRRVVRGEIPVFFHANSALQLRGVIEFVDEQKLKGVVIVGGDDAWRFADELKARDIAVITGGVLSLPPRASDPYDEGFTLPARLAAAGVRFCISDGGGRNVANARNLPFHAGMAAAFGLPRDEALKAVTLYPAQILGVGDRLGSIEPGKIADLQVTDGDPLMEQTHCERVLIAGRPISMESRQTRLFHKYDSRPRGPHARPR
jgi:imidazolonepropionase-like amidohydrolase